MATEKPYPLSPDPQRDVVLDRASLRAVAHPVRLRILGILRMEGPSTATALAAKLGLNSGATSYHLRQLATGGLVEEDTERGTGRDRWWRALHRSTFFDPTTMPNEDQEVGVAYERAIAQVYAEKMYQAAEDRPMQPEKWRRAGRFSDFALALTADEASQLMHEIDAVLARYLPHDADDAPVGAQPFHLQLQAFLRPGLDLPPDE